MTDIAPDWRARPVEETNLPAYYAEVESFQRAQLRRTKMVNLGLGIVAGVALLGNVALSIGAASMLPLVRLVPVFYWVQTDGTVDAVQSLSVLPPTQEEAVIRSAVWEYVRDREGYSFSNARDSYDRIRYMSTDDVNGVYQRWFDQKNPESPQKTVGENGQIKVEHLGTVFIRDRVAQVRFRRTVVMKDDTLPNPLMCRPPTCTTWTATLNFDLLDSLPDKARLFNPGGLVVTRYQVSEGAQ